ncbi:hypothetical protein FT663_03627 [Candidozyma haemuli var. vulneris]|uniref:Kinetochore-associated protein n=1 Tax=Candidozyma haemuli TaxID=45357 RepID=A0A2V1AX89_9ASCO|nr:hypothetical protein CXQ85_005034 [[Candida] haemuloni]KAF3989180.1 hypothetical protein FT662_02996 [[Candida] haemuloni var. vulneris]KAF3989430.1 hypothetical protein FT663_03627 [[Candida] haemuloni var. vulneris]PVH22465.1 hypothetical protein CXQ85_005034 [[Candida] haemuloni]
MSYEKIRFNKLRRVTEKAVEQTVKKSLQPETIEKCFPVISEMKGGKSALETARKQILQYFQSTSEKQFQYIFEQNDIERKLDELDEIIQAAQARRDSGTEEPLFIEKLTPQQLIDARVGASKAETVTKLQLIYDQLLLDNKQLHEEIVGLVDEGATVKDDLLSQIEAVASGVDEIKKAEFDQNYDKLIDDVLR